jgi:hypothetical protein
MPVRSPAPSGRDQRARDALVVRRALRAGGLTWLVIGGLLLASVLNAGGGGQAGMAALLLGLVFAGVVTSAWLLLATVLDLLADDPPSRRRILFTAGVTLFTLLSPVLVAGARG